MRSRIIIYLLACMQVGYARECVTDYSLGLPDNFPHDKAIILITNHGNIVHNHVLSVEHFAQAVGKQCKLIYDAGAAYVHSHLHSHDTAGMVVYSVCVGTCCYACWHVYKQWCIRKSADSWMNWECADTCSDEACRTEARRRICLRAIARGIPSLPTPDMCYREALDDIRIEFSALWYGCTTDQRRRLTRLQDVLIEALSL